MSGAWKPLPIWCAAGRVPDADMARLRLAKEALWLDYRVLPEEAAEGTMVERVLAWGSAPDFVCSYALVDPAGTQQEIEDAVAWVLHEGACAAAIEYEQVLQVLLGPDVREITAEELLAEQRLADYEAGV